MPAIGAHVAIQISRGDSHQTMVAQVDGGNGHSGQCAPELHFGLGPVDAQQTLEVSIRWRDRAGNIHDSTIASLRPGWHTVYLESADFLLSSDDEVESNAGVD